MMANKIYFYDDFEGREEEEEIILFISNIFFF